MRGRTPASHYPLPTINRKCTLLCDLCVTFALFALKPPSTNYPLFSSRSGKDSASPLGFQRKGRRGFARYAKALVSLRFAIFRFTIVCEAGVAKYQAAKRGVATPPRRRALYGNIPPFRDAEAASPLLLRSSQPTTLNSQPTTHQSQIVNRSIVNSTNYPLPTTIYLSSLCDAHDRAFPKARGQFVARTDILRPTHDAPCAIHRKRIASLQRVRRIKQG